MTFLSLDLTTAPGRGAAPPPVATLTPRGSAARTVGEEQAGDVSLRSTRGQHRSRLVPLPTEPVATLVRPEGLTEAAPRMPGFPGRAGGYLRGPAHAGLACGWWTCVALLDLRRLLMAREPPGPAASCRERKALSVGTHTAPGQAPQSGRGGRRWVWREGRRQLQPERPRPPRASPSWREVEAPRPRLAEGPRGSA